MLDRAWAPFLEAESTTLSEKLVAYSPRLFQGHWQEHCSIQVAFYEHAMICFLEDKDFLGNSSFCAGENTVIWVFMCRLISESKNIAQKANFICLFLFRSPSFLGQKDWGTSIINLVIWLRGGSVGRVLDMTVLTISSFISRRGSSWHIIISYFISW